MISAEEARRQKCELNSLEERIQLEKVEEGVKKDIKRGHTYYYGKLQDTVICELKRLGYKVEYYSDQRDGCTTTIKW